MGTGSLSGVLTERRAVSVSLSQIGCRDQDAFNFEPPALVALEGINVANVTLRLYPEQAHFNLAVWAEY